MITSKKTQYKSDIQYATKIKMEYIKKLLDGSSCALILKNYYLPEHCKLLQRKLVENEYYGTYANVSNINRVGEAFFESMVMN